MEIKEKIEFYKNKNLEIEETKRYLIDAHIQQINQVIEDKIIQLQNELREDAIKEVCGEEYNVLNKEIDKNNKYIEILVAMDGETEFIENLKDIIPADHENCPEMAETDEANKLQTDIPQTEETTVTCTNQDYILN